MNTGTTEIHEMEAWLGDDHGLTDEQVAELARIADDITARYCTPEPGVDDPEEVRADLLATTAEERDAALTAAYRLLAGDTAVVAELARELAAAATLEARAKAGLRQAATMLVEPTRPGHRNPRSEEWFANLAGVTRLTVRKWLGKG